ncbi:MAG: hypothetical protein RKL24_03525 [Defluviicoccus sp.]|nr:hypothetical protein [Defluviicoccus sp.]
MSASSPQALRRHDPKDKKTTSDIDIRRRHGMRIKRACDAAAQTAAELGEQFDRACDCERCTAWLSAGGARTSYQAGNPRLLRREFWPRTEDAGLFPEL